MLVCFCFQLTSEHQSSSSHPCSCVRAHFPGRKKTIQRCARVSLAQVYGCLPSCTVSCLGTEVRRRSSWFLCSVKKLISFIFPTLFTYRECHKLSVKLLTVKNFFFFNVSDRALELFCDDSGTSAQRLININAENTRLFDFP